MVKMEYFDELKQSLIEGMISYMEFDDGDTDAPYAQEDVDECERILNGYLGGVFEAGITQDEIEDEVKKAVLALNELNDRCGGGLIETDQREELCELFIEGARAAGYDFEELENDDITERWREW